MVLARSRTSFQEVVLDHRTRDADGIAFLEGILADRVAGHLARDHDHRNRIHIRGGQAGDGIGDAGAGGDQGDAHGVRAARIGVGGVHRGLFVANEDVLEFILVEDGVVDIEDRAARVTEDVLDALFCQTTDHYLSARDRDC